MINKAQHEIVGFVLIVLIVSIIGVVFLSIVFSKEEISKHTSVEISNLLEASMYATTDCAINYIPQYRDMQDLLKECYKDITGDYRECLGGRSVCEVLERDLKNIVEAGLEIGEDSPNKAYKLNIYFTYDDNSPNENILSFESGNFINCSSIVGGKHSIVSGSSGYGTIEVELIVCKG